MGAEIKQYNGSFVSPKDDAVMYEKFHCETGVVKGVEITHTGTNQILVGAGYIYIPGRMVEIEEETVLCELQTEETEGELILYVDLSADTPATLLARAPRVELTQEDINDSGTVYEFLLATFTIDNTVISDLAVAYGELRPNLPMSQTGDEYDSAADYDEGALFIKDNALCKATEALVGGEHDESKIEKTTIAAELASLNGKTSEMFEFSSCNTTVTVSASGSSNGTIMTPSIDGYSVISLKGFTSSNNNVVIRGLNLNQNTTNVSYYVRNISTSSEGATLTAYLLYARSELL